MKRRIDESVGIAAVVAEGGFGVARDVAGSGIGVARDVAGTALMQFLAVRANGAVHRRRRRHRHRRRRRARADAPSRAPAPTHAGAGPRPPVPPDAAWTRRRRRRRRAPDPRLRRAVGVAGGRAARRPRPRVARGDPSLRGRPPRPQHDPRQDRAAHLTWKASRAATAEPTSRASSSWPASMRAELSVMQGGELWLAREAWPEPLDDAYRALLDARRRARRRRHHRRRRARVRRGARRDPPLRRAPRRDHRPVRRGRGAGGRRRRGDGRRRSSTSAASAAASASTRSRCPGHRATKNFFEDARLHRPRADDAPAARPATAS